MTTQEQVKYIWDYETGEILNYAANGNDDSRHKYHYQIDSRGNVKIEHTSGAYWKGQLTWSKAQTRLSIVDNIPIPAYLVDMLKELISCKADHNSGFWDNKLINVFNKIKSGLKELVNKPLDATDIKSQLGFSMNKNEILQNELKEMEQKIKNIQSAYFDTLKDNEKLKKEKGTLSEKNTNLNYELNKDNAAKEIIKKDMVRLTSENLILNLELARMTPYSIQEPELKTEYTQSHSLRDCFHNPGGATVYTKSNARNRMVYNPSSGIYEPEEN